MGVGIDLDIGQEVLNDLRDFAESTQTPALELFLRSGEEHAFIVVISQELVERVPHAWIRIGSAVVGERVTLRGAELPVAEISWHWK